MQTIGMVVLGAILAVAFWWGVMPALRRLPWWGTLSARLWALAGNSRTIAVAYLAELLAALDEAKLLDWSSLVGAERAGRVLAIMGIVMLLLRLVTRTAVEFRAR